MAGDAARVYIPSAAPRDVLAVPRDALVLREDNTYVFKVDGKAPPSVWPWKQGPRTVPWSKCTVPSRRGNAS